MITKAKIVIVKKKKGSNLLGMEKECYPLYLIIYSTQKRRVLIYC